MGGGERMDLFLLILLNTLLRCLPVGGKSGDQPGGGKRGGKRGNEVNISFHSPLGGGGGGEIENL